MWKNKKLKWQIKLNKPDVVDVIKSFLTVSNANVIHRGGISVVSPECFKLGSAVNPKL